MFDLRHQTGKGVINMKEVAAYSLRLFGLNVLIAFVLGLLVVSVVLIVPGKPLIVYSIIGLFFFVYLVGWFYYAKWVSDRQMEDVLIQSSLIGFSPNFLFGMVGCVGVALLALLDGKPSTIFVYGVLSISSILFAVVGVIAIYLYKKKLDRNQTGNVH